MSERERPHKSSRNVEKEPRIQENEKPAVSDILKEWSEQHLEQRTKCTECFVTGRRTLLSLLSDVGKINFTLI